MKGQVLTCIGGMELVELGRPGLEKDSDVLLKVEMVGVCGSDVHYYETGRIGSQVVEYPYLVGHECSGIVEEVGSKVTTVKVGERVVVDPAISCGQCDQCKAGREHTCRELKFLGCPGQIDGCMCEYIVMPERSCYSTAGKITAEQAVLCEPFAIGVYAVRQAALPSEANIAVLGAGPIGLSCLVAAGAQKAGAVYMTDRIAERVEIAEEAGAAWAGNPDEEDIVSAILKHRPSGMDTVFECAGQQSTLDEAVDLLRPGGKLMLVGIPRADRVSFSIDKIRRKEISIINVRRQNECTQAAIDLIASGRVNLDFMVTHKFDFVHAHEAFDLVANYQDGVIKALINLT